MTEYETMLNILQRISTKRKFNLEASKQGKIRIERSYGYNTEYLTLYFDDAGNVEDISISAEDSYPSA